MRLPTLSLNKKQVSTKKSELVGQIKFMPFFGFLWYIKLSQMNLQVTFKIYQLISLSSHFLKAWTKYEHLFPDKKFVGINLELSKNDKAKKI